MILFDRFYINLYNNDEVTYNKNKYKLTILNDGITLSNTQEDIFIKCNNGDILYDIEVFVTAEDYENDLFDFGG